jgi:hypothetical protein
VTELEQRVLGAISQRRLKPRPYAYFLAKRSVFWTLAALSLVLGGVCVALLIFVAVDYLATGGRGFDEMPFDDVAEFLPAIWFACFLLFVASATLSLARTKRGYRYRPRRIAIGAAAASIGLGLLLYGTDTGGHLNRFLKARFPAYAEYTYIPYAEWSRPDEGYLGGEVLSAEEGRSLRLRAFDGREWMVDISAAEIGFAEPLVDEGDVAIRGERTGPLTFKAKRIDEFD